MKNAAKRCLSFLLVAIMLLQLIPVGITAVQAEATKAVTDLTSAINGLSSPIAQSNKLLDNVTVSNTGLLVGTYYIVHKDANGTYRVLDPLCLSNGQNIAGASVTVSGTSINGADPSMAIDITHDSSNTYYLHTSDGRYLREYAYGNTPCIVAANNKSLSFGINFYGTSTAYQAHSVRIYRNFAVNGAAKTFDLHYNGSSEFGWIQNVSGHYPVTHQFFLYKIAQRWDSSELYNAIQTMKDYASANNGRFAEGIHAAFMECMEKSINLYKTYNVATGSQTYEQVVAIRSELKAQTEWLLSYKDVLQASYADAAAAIPTPTNTYVPVSWGSWTIELMDQLRDGTYFVVNHGENATTGHVVDLSQEYHVNDLIVAQDVEICNGKVLNADPNWSIYFEDVNNSDGNRNRYYTAFKPINGLKVALETTPAGSDYHNIAYYGGARACEISHKGSALYIDSHPNDKDYNQDGRNDRYALTYIPAENGFRLKLDLNEVQTTDNSIHLYRIATRSIELYKAIKRLAPYATGNADERYPTDTYSKFITCLTESIKLYQQYNVTLNTTDKANLSAIEKSMNDKATELRGFLSTLTKQDAVTPYIDIPVEIYDFRADGLMFEYLNAHYNLASVSAGSSLTIPGNWSNHGRINLTTGKLTNRKLSYTEQVVTFVVNSFYEEGALSNLHEGNHAPGWNSAFYDLLPTVTNTPMDKGSYNETINKTKNGGELSWSDVKTYYDLAYYLLTYMWRPVPEGDIVDTKNNLPYNVTVTERDRLRLYADENGNYVLDADNDVLYDGYYTYNPTPRAKEDITYASPLFTPADGLGFETDEMLEKLGGDTDRGGLYAGYGTASANTNFHFTMHAYGSFVYYESQNQYFDFLGDDDVYFFIDGKIALDLGGAHQALGGRVDLNSLGLVDGEVYDFDMFYAERHTSASNLKFSTNIKIVDTDTLTTMGQYAETYNGSSKVDAATGLGASIIDNGAVYVGDTTAYSFDLMNTRNLPVYDISFVSTTLGTSISGSSLILYKSSLTNGAVTDIKDITVYYRTVTQDENGENIIHSGTPVAKSYTDMTTLLSKAIQNNTTLVEGSYRVSISSEEDLKALLLLGIPHNCQISVYGFKRNTTENDTPFTNTVSSRCYYTRVATNEGSAGGEVFTLNGSASRKLRVSANLPSIDPQQIVMDYGKPVEIPVTKIAESIYTDSFVTVTGFVGITLKGGHGQVLKNSPAGLVCTTVESTLTTENGIFTRTEDGLRFELTDFFDAIETVNLVYSLEGCELTDPDGSNTIYKYILVQLQLIPATSMYYETDFTEGVFDLSSSSTYLYFDFGNTYEDQIRYQGKAYGFYNFDTEGEGYWATRGTSSTTNIFNGYSIDNNEGVLTLQVASGRPINDAYNYGPWLSTTTTYRQNPSAATESNLALDFDPSNSEVVQIRFKVSGCEVTSATDPRVVVVYDHTTDGKNVRGAYDMVKSYSYVDDIYMVLTFDLSNEFKNADSIRSFGFRFWDLQSKNNGAITIDYIYVGPKAKLPYQEQKLFFDFTNTTADRQRYNSDVYAGLNFDLNANWARTSSFKPVAIDSSNIGTLSVELTDSTTATWHYIQTGPTTGDKPLSYTPGSNDIFQIRLKIDNAVSSDTTNNAVRVGFYYYLDDETSTRVAYKDYKLADYNNKGYFTVTLSMKSYSYYVNANRLTMIRPYFNFVKSSDTAAAKITVDYIYLGPENNAPTNEPMFFDFKNTELDRERYESAVYTGTNFDLAQNWTKTGSFKPITVDYASIGTLSLELTDTTTETWHYIQTKSSLSDRPLNYTPGSDDIFQIRMKIDNAASSDTANNALRVGFYYYLDDETDTRVTYKDYALADYNDKGYFIVTLPMKSYSYYVNASRLKMMRPYFNFVKSSDTVAAKITVDYIYLGPKDHAPKSEPLFFDFTNTELDQERYQSATYNGTNYDLAKNWTIDSSFKKSSVVDATEGGTLNLELIDNYSANGWHQLQAGTPGSAQGLNFVRGANDVFQMRMKIEDAALIDTNSEKAGAIRIGFGFASDSSTTVNYRYTNVLFEDYANNGYFTITLPMASTTTYLAASHTTMIRPYIHFLGSSSTAAAKIQIDYIYLGDKDKLEETLNQEKHVWQTITDTTSPDKYQDVDMVDNETTSYAVAASPSENAAEQEVRTATRASASLNLPDGVTVASTKEYTLADGVTETTVTVNAKKLAVYIAEIGASSKTTLKVSTPGYYTVGSTEESRVANFYSMANDIAYTTNQAAAYEAATGETILFAMNGSFFDGDEVNRGPLVLEGNVLQGWFGTLRKEPMFALMKDGSYAILDFTDDFANVEEAIGARHRLVKNGVNVIAGAAEDSDLIYTLHPRTAIGLKADGSVVCIVVDGRTQAGYTTGGINLPDLADLMISLGCVDAVNLDGGGSSTFVTRRTPTGNLAMRNISSEAAGQRTVASALMFISTEDHCQHVYANNDYRMLSEGRHELLCDICRQGIDSPHRYSNGVCECGKQEEVSPNLFFDFANTPADRERYNNAAYGYHNFDIPTNATWWRGLWATQSTDSDSHPRYDFEIYNESGIMRVDVADTTGDENKAEANRTDKPYGETWNYGPYIITTSVFYQWPGTTDEASLALNYDPSQAEIAQIRFKLEGCSATTTTPSVVLWGNCTKDGKNASAPQLAASYTYVENEYIVADIPLTDAFRTCGTIRSLGLRFKDIYSDAVESDNSYGDRGDQGTVAIDYIYVGTREGAPTYDDLFIDFTNTKADQQRYATHTFSGLNLDLAENWTPMPNFKAPVISDGVMTLTHKYNTINNGYVTPGSTLESRPLNYVPSADDYLQIRLRIDGAVSTAASANGRFVMFYADDTGNTVPGNDNFVAYNFPNGTILDQGWVTLTFKISDMITSGKNFTQYDSISRISPGFYWLQSAEGGFASFQIDYIYIGSEEGLPSFDKPVYGYDSSYTDDSKLSNGSSLFVMGEGIPNIEKDSSGNPSYINYAAADTYTEISFTFTGTGFDIISRTGVNQGMIRAVILDSNKTIVKNVSVINKGESELYQIPVLSVEGLAHGTYTVKLFVDKAFDYGNNGNADIFGGAMDRGGEFYFDALRIYNPINTQSADINSVNAYEVYQKHGEADPTITELRDILIDANSFTAGSTMNGVVYLDATALPGTNFDNANGKLTATIAKYKAIGPNNEVYLLPGNAIAFKLEVEGPIPASIDIGAKSANGADVSMVVSVTTTVPTTLPTGPIREIQTSTALFYPMDILASRWKTVTVNNRETHYVYVTIYNSGTQGILSITDIKYAYDFPNPNEPVSRKAVRFVVDAPMLEMYTNSCDHTWDQGKITTAPTCTAEGIKTFTCTLCGIFYTETVAALGHSYTNGVCICGQKEVKEPVEEAKWKMGHTLNLASDISVNLVIGKSLLEGFDMETVYVLAELDTYEGDIKTGAKTIKILPKEQNEYYYFTLKGLTAVNMNDRIRSVLYGTKDGQVYYSPVDEYSVATYAYSQMNKAAVARSLKVLCADLLRYGAKAQIFKGYRTDSLADAAMTNAHKAYLSDMSKVAFGNTNVTLNDLSAPSITWAGKVLNLQSKVTLKFVFNTAGYSGNLDDLNLRVSYTDIEGKSVTTIVEEIEAYNAVSGLYAFSFDSLLAAELRSVVSVQVYAGETPVSCTLQYSADTYGNNKTGTLLDLCKALFAYSDSAKAYFQ